MMADVGTKSPNRRERRKETAERRRQKKRGQQLENRVMKIVNAVVAHQQSTKVQGL